MEKEGLKELALEVADRLPAQAADVLERFHGGEEVQERIVRSLLAEGLYFAAIERAIHNPV